MKWIAALGWLLVVAWGAAKLLGWAWGSVSGAVAPATPAQDRDLWWTSAEARRYWAEEW